MKKEEIVVIILLLLMVIPFSIYQDKQKEKEKAQLKIDPIQIEAVVSKLSSSGRYNRKYSIHYSYIYNDIEYEDSDKCSKWLYKYREDGRLGANYTTYFSIIGDTFNIIISKSHPEYSDFIEDQQAFKQKYYLNKEE